MFTSECITFRLASGCDLLFSHCVSPAFDGLGFLLISASLHTSRQWVVSAFEFLSPLIYCGIHAWVTVKTNGAFTRKEATDGPRRARITAEASVLEAWRKFSIFYSFSYKYKSFFPMMLMRARWHLWSRWTAAEAISRVQCFLLSSESSLTLHPSCAAVFIAGSGMYKRTPPQGNILLEVCRCIGVSHLPSPVIWDVKHTAIRNHFVLQLAFFYFAVCHQKPLEQLKVRREEETLVGLGWGEVLGKNEATAWISLWVFFRAFS